MVSKQVGLGVEEQAVEAPRGEEMGGQAGRRGGHEVGQGGAEAPH